MSHIVTRDIMSDLKYIPENKRIFAERLRARLVEIEMSQKQLARLTCLTAASISEYINGGRVPRVADFARIADILNCSMDWLWGRDDTKQPESQEPQTVIELEAQLHEIAENLRALANTADSRIKTKNKSTIGDNAHIFGDFVAANITIHNSTNNKPQ